MRTIRLALPAALAMLALSGCEQLCGPNGIGVFCPESEDNPLNDPPVVSGDITFHPSNSFTRCTDQALLDSRTTFRLGPRPGPSVVFDPDGDPLLFEWDLDGDGEFEAGGTGGLGSGVPGEEVSTFYRRPGAVQVRVRVSDFPQHLGAPGAVERTARVLIPDRARNTPPVAALTASAPIIAGFPATFDAGATADPDFYDVEGIAYGWDFGDGSFAPLENLLDPGFRTVAHTYAEPGDYTVRLTVGDCAGGSDHAELRLTVRPRTPSTGGPRASFTVSPPSPLTGELVTFDGSASTDDIVRYEWDLDGNDVFERSGRSPLATTTFDRAGEHVVGLRVTDDAGLVHLERGSVIVRRNRLPTARFTVFPASPFAGTEVTFDGSSSEDFEGEIARYEWDLDGNGSFETDNGGEPTRTTTYETSGTRFVQLRVTDSVGATGTAFEEVVVVDPGALAATAQARRKPPASAFSARIAGRPVSGRRGERDRRGSRLSLRGVVGRGRMRVRVLDAPGRSAAAERRLARFLRAPWRTHMSFGFDRRTSRWTAKGIALARAKRARACLRVRLSKRPGEHATGRLKLLGGRGAGARLRGRARFRFRLERDGSATVLGSLRARTGRTRALPRRCRRLAAQVRGARTSVRE